jgi:hypothetical protein
MDPQLKVSSSLNVVELDEDHAKAVEFNMLFIVWRRRTMSAPYRRGMHIVRGLAARFPEGVGVCQVVEVDAVPPDSDARTAFVEFLRLAALKHYSVTHDGVGFKAASVRAIVASGHALARPTCKHSVHSSMASAAGWHAAAQAVLGRHESAMQIENIVRALRAVHRDRYP